MVVVTAFFLCCTDPSRIPQPSGWDEGINLPLAQDLNPDPNIVELNLEAKVAPIVVKGQTLQMWTYNGLVPGPVIRSKVGQTVIIHFTNYLPEDTTVHWHGVKVPADMDGSEMVQSVVPPGGSFEYRFVTPEAGLFWYHPHVNSSAQVGYGLYGAFEVTDDSEKFFGDPLTLVMSDISVANGGVAPGDDLGWFGDYFGREGDLLWVNGRVEPTVKARAGIPQRWKIVNTARARYFQIDLGTLEARRIGGDVGLITDAQPAAPLVLTPGERAELWVKPTQAATRIPISWVDSDRFHIGTLREPKTLFWVDVVNDAAVEGAVTPGKGLKKLTPLDGTNAIRRNIQFMEASSDAGVGFLGINGKAWDPNGAHEMAKVGTTEQWEVWNSTGYDHTFHLHGFSFQPLDLTGKGWPVLEFKDSINVPAKQKLHLLVYYDDRPGMWMFHCHILDHIELGMMAMLHVSR